MIDALFGSKTRVKLLYLFLNNPDMSFYVREITRKIDEQINSVRRELSNMLDIGIIKSKNENNKIYYEVDKNYTFYEPLRQIFVNSSSSQDAASSDDEIIRRFDGLGDVRLVILAGKLVSGSVSDVDVLIAGNDINDAKLKSLVKFIENDKGISISYAVLPYEDFYYRLSVRDKFVTDILGTKYSVIIDTENIFNREDK